MVNVVKATPTFMFESIILIVRILICVPTRIIDSVGMNNQSKMIAEIEASKAQLTRQVEEYQAVLNETNMKLDSLRQENSKLRREKEDALYRLSQMVSVKLRDNNPNIVDLNDPFRPTKLAEMFSELYDNEWTSAYCTLESKRCFQYTRFIIGFLLDIVMECSLFTKHEIDGTWRHVEKWFLNDDLSMAQQAKRTLEEGLKLNVPHMSKGVAKKFKEHLRNLLAKYDGSTMMECMSLEDVEIYVDKCTLLCLLMNACSPRVVVCCPNWRLLQWRKNAQNRTTLRRRSENGMKNDHGDDDDASYSYDEQIDNDAFDRSRFKDYTKRGNYIFYYVWPVMFLHQDGPLLGKGVAQGTRDRYSYIENL